MLSSINPLGERAKGQRFWMTVTWYVLGSIAGGLTIGTMAGMLGSLFPTGTWRAGAIVLLGLLGATFDGIGRVPTALRRQVDENWLGRYRGWVYGLGFGFQLGLGVATIVTTASVYTTIGVAFLLGSPLLGAMVGVAFGLARAMVIVIVGGASDPARLRAVMRRLQTKLPVANWLAVTSQLAVVVMAATVL
jgi:hypothetical protein